jgi:hypothetical protein
MTEGERTRAKEGWRSSPLWQRLAAMRIEAEGAALTFAARLARENGWSGRHAAAVVEEYRRFLYLAATAGPVTPSEDVDQAWHLHLSYTRHYWDELCGRIIGMPLHHDPTEGGAGQRAHYHRQYEQTLARYRTIFGAPPPRQVWPDAEARFAARPRRVDAGRYRLLPRARAGRLPLLGFGALLVAACTALLGNSAGTGDGAIVIISILAVVAVFAGALALAGRGTTRKRDDGGCSGGGGCTGGNHHDGAGGCASDGGGGGGCGGGCGGS